ncbi:MAG: hypothetical protein H6742_15245 [Alphaproteobacteria bacterium]|nr:hypothetical protein [Alphaproteobacteria bacterium]
MPGILTGLGIFGTFVGITIGLVNFRVGPEGASGVDMAQQVQQLIPTLGIAFFTSILGLFFSLISRVLLTAKDEALQKTLRRLGAQADRNVPGTTVEALQIASFEQAAREAKQVREVARGSADSVASRIENRLDAMAEAWKATVHERLGEEGTASVDALLAQQNTALGTIGQDVADAVDRAIAQGFDAALHGQPAADGRPATQGLLTQIDEVVGQLRRSHQEGAGQLADHLADQIDARLGPRLDGFSAAVEGARQAAEHWTSGVQGLTGQVESAARLLDDAHSRLSEAVQQADTLAGRIEGFLSRMDSALSVQVEGLEGQERLLRTAVQGIEGQNQQWEAQATQLQTLQQDLAGLAAAAQGIASWHDTQRTILQDQLDAWKAGLAEQRTLTEAFGQERAKTTEMVSTVEGAVRTFAELGTKLEGLSGTLRAEMEGLEARRASTGETVDDAVDRLRQLSTTMQSAFEAYQQSADVLREGLPDVASLLAQLRDASTANERVIERTGTLADTIGAAAEAHQRAADGLASFQHLPDTLQPLLDSVQAASVQLAESTGPMSTTATHLAAIAKRLDGMDSRLADADEQATKRWAETADRMDQARAALHGSTQEITRAVNDYVTQLNQALADSTNQQREQWGDSLASIKEALGSLQGLASTLRESTFVLADAVNKLDDTRR